MLLACYRYYDDLYVVAFFQKICLNVEGKLNCYVVYAKNIVSLVLTMSCWLISIPFEVLALKLKLTDVEIYEIICLNICSTRRFMKVGYHVVMLDMKLLDHFPIMLQNHCIDYGHIILWWMRVE